MTAATPLLDDREAQAIAAALLARRAGYVPGWVPPAAGPSAAIVQVLARYLRTLAERVNQAPDKNKLAFLDLLGVQLLSAQSARAPLVFEAVPHTGDSHVPAGTRVGAKVAGQTDPLIFETEETVALAAARLVEVVSLWPGRDAYADHSAALHGARPFSLFEPLAPVPHALYVAHDAHLALAGTATVELQVELESPASAPLPLAWEYWDGQGWRAFNACKPAATAGDRDSQDGTLGLTRSGVVRLAADCADAAKTAVDGFTAYWVRARVTAPLLAVGGPVLPTLDRLAVRTVLRHDVWQHARAAGTPSAALTLEGVIRDERGTPLAGLRIDLAPEGGGEHQVATTDPQGHYRIEAIPPNKTWQVVIRGRSDLPTLGGQPPSAAGPLDPTAVDTLSVGAESLIVDWILGAGAKLDAAFVGRQRLDLTQSFFPLDRQPAPGTVFYLSSAEAFGKPGATVTVYAGALGPLNPDGLKVDRPRLVAEYWDGDHWRALAVRGTSDPLVDLLVDGAPIQFEVPADLSPTAVQGQDGWWIRIRQVDEGFLTRRTLTLPGVDTTHPIKITVVAAAPPVLSSLRVAYVYRSPPDAPQHCLTDNDFQWADQTAAASTRGGAFAPFQRVADPTPALYLGFDRSLPADLVGLYLDLAEVADDAAGPPLRWEYWDGTAWLGLRVRDETANLVLPGMAAVLWPGAVTPPSATVVQASGTRVDVEDARQAARFSPGDRVVLAQNGSTEQAVVVDVAGPALTLRAPLRQSYGRATLERATLARFGTPRTWLRARLMEDGEPRRTRVNGIYANAVWAAQRQTIENEPLGSSDGQPNQTFFLRRTPVLAGEVVEVRELEGPRAAVDLPLLQRELAEQGLAASDLRTVADPRTGRVSEVWVRWRGRPHLYHAGPRERVYVIERSRGRVRLGDGRHGGIAPPGRDNVRARVYHAGGLALGNVAAGGINQLLSGVIAQRVGNPRAAEGGADGEPLSGVLRRGPEMLRHRRQALSLADYEALAREASPAVAVARARPTTDGTGRTAVGWVSLVVIPQSQEPQPQPSFGLRRQVQQFLAARAPAAVAGRISVVGPAYLPIGVQAVVSPLDPSAAGTVLDAARGALEQFLHPLRGGPDGDGWPFGRAVYLSDVAALLEALDGVDYVETLELLLDGTPRGDVVAVPTDRVVAAGALRLTLSGGEG